MADMLWDDSEYPYHAQWGGRDVQESMAAGRNLIPWALLLRWAKRVAVGSVVGLLLAVATGVFFGHRAISRALLATYLDSQGCDLGFVHQMPGQTDSLHPVLRRLVGDFVGSEIAEVRFIDNSWRSDREKVEAVCKAFRSLEKLQSLTVQSDDFAFAMIADLPQLQQLERLDLAPAPIQVPDLEVIRGMTALKELRLVSPHVSAADLAVLSSLPNLESLEVEVAQGAAAGGTPAGGFAKLQRLVLRGSITDDAVILSFGPLPQLIEVELTQANLSDRGIAPLLASPALQSLIINDAAETDGENIAIIRCPGPAIFHLPNVAVSDQGLSGLAGRAVNSLVLDGTRVTDGGLATIGTLEDLRYLSLRETKVTGSGAGELAQLNNLATLDLRGTLLNDEAAAALASLRVNQLIVANTALTDAGLLVLADNDALRQLDITGTRVTAEGLRAFYEARKKRLQTGSRREYLIVETDYPDVADRYVERPADMPGGEFGMPGYGF